MGSFFYLNGDDFLLADLGCGEYTKDYFAEKRYTYLCCRSLGHNLPLIDGREQLPGEEYGCDRFETEADRIVLSFAGAYGNPGLESLVRTLDWDEREGILQVEDCFRIRESIRSIRENLITQWEPWIQGNTIRIQGDKAGCQIQVEGEPVEIVCIRQDFYDHGGVRRDVWLLQWEVPIKGEAFPEGQARTSFFIKPV